MDFEEMRQEKIEYFRAQAEQYHFTREYGRAMLFYVRAGLLGDLDSVQEVCDKLKSGYGMSYNYDEIFRCMEIGAKAGIADAMYELGVCYSNGLGTEVDIPQAMHWFSEGAEAGNEAAKLSMRAYNYDLKLEEYDELSPFAAIVRDSVYVKEKGLENAFDTIDASAHHLVLFDGNKPVATCRVYWSEDMQAYLLDKLAVIREYRAIGLSKDLVLAGVAYVKSQMGKAMAIYVDEDAIPFYEELGFAPEGKRRDEGDKTYVWVFRRFYF